MNEQALHVDLYQELVKLDKANKNGVWARIIKNAFAPLFVGTVDFIAGNPPWVYWNNLPEEYREQVRDVMTNRYGLMAKRASTMKRLGAAGKDISMLFFYVAFDAYLKPEGKLGYVITQTLFQTGAGDEFRQFEIPGKGRIKIELVEDWVEVQPFRKSAGNKTAVVIASRGRTSYPIPYVVFSAVMDFDREDSDLSKVFRSCHADATTARPSNPNNSKSFWQVAPVGRKERSISSIPNSAKLVPRVGIDTKLEAVFHVRIVRELKNDCVLIENIRERAKKNVSPRQAAVEKSALKPIVSGSTLSRWKWETDGYYVLLHDAATGMSPIDELTVRRRFPKAYDYLSFYREQLSERSIHKRWGKGNPFYAVYNIGGYTFAKHRILWQATTKNFGAALVDSINDPWLGEVQVVGKKSTICLALGSETEALMTIGLLNSSIARERINRAITTWVPKDIVDVVPEIPDFNQSVELHRRLVETTREIVSRAQDSTLRELSGLEQQVDRLAAELWQVPEAELKKIQDAVA